MPHETRTAQEDSAGDRFAKGSSAAEDSARWERNRRHWEEVVEATNLSGAAGARDFARQVSLYRTADVREALAFLTPLGGAQVLDLGGGNGLAAALFARRGARVLVVDISLPRLLEARRQLARLGLADRVEFLLASGDRLPLRTGTVDRIFTKSVLIHTRLDETARECGRVLAEDGSAAFVEPQRRNPFVNLYRRFAAPKAWREITTYFSSREWRTVRTGVGARGPGCIRQARLRPFFFLGFFASVLIFVRPSPRSYFAAERVLCAVDRALFRALPTTRRRAWFGVMLLEKMPRHGCD